MSTQEAVTPAAKAAPIAALIVVACWLWLVGAVGVGLLAWILGGGERALAMATALAIAPALAGFMLLPRLGRWTADLGLVTIWLLAGIGLVAGSGGAGSPALAVLAIPPAISAALGRAWAAETGAATVLGYAGAAGLSILDPNTATLGLWPEFMVVLSLAYAAGLIALARGSGLGRGSAIQHVAEVSHELRTPLTHILGFAEMIERRMFGEIAERYVEYAGLIRHSGGQLLNLVNDLLDIGKIEARRYELNLSRFDARDVVADVARQSTDAAERRNIRLALVTPEHPLWVHADLQALQRVLQNLVGNALRFAPDGGHVFVSAAAHDGSLRMEVTDDGPGFPPDERTRLTEAYRQGARSAGGTGLGLSLVRGLVTLQGGVMNLGDAPGGGALVRVDLPVLASGE